MKLDFIIRLYQRLAVWVMWGSRMWPSKPYVKLWRISAACPHTRLSNQCHHLGELKLARCHSSIQFSGNLNFHQWKWGWQHHKTGFELCWISRTKATFWWHFFLWLPSKYKHKTCSTCLRRGVGSFRHVFMSALVQGLSQELLQTFSLTPLRTLSLLAGAPSWDKLLQQDALPEAFLLLSLSNLPPLLGRFGLHYSVANNSLTPSWPPSCTQENSPSSACGTHCSVKAVHPKK